MVKTKINITKVYTRNGDQGQTQLAYARAIAKNAVRICLMGEIDELNSHLGFALVTIKAITLLNNVHQQGLRIQNELFNLGAQFAVLPKDKKVTTPAVTTTNTELLEQELDMMNASLPHLKSFILPGGGEAAVRFHLARAICRRAERTMVGLAQQEQDTFIGTELPYLNRLSDWLFVAARYVAAQLDAEELLWQPH